MSPYVELPYSLPNLGTTTTFTCFYTLAYIYGFDRIGQDRTGRVGENAAVSHRMFFVSNSVLRVEKTPSSFLDLT